MNAAEIPNLGEQALLKGQKYLENRHTILLGICPDNPYYYKTETLEKLFHFAESHSDKVLLFIPDKISEHNYRAVGSKNPERKARKVAHPLRTKCKDVMKKMGCDDKKFSFVNWVEEVEPCPAYIEAYQTIMDLYQQGNEQFRLDIQEVTRAVLKTVTKVRGNATETTMDVDEGAKYLLKELACFDVIPSIYKNCEEFVFVYHRREPIAEKYYGGHYDGNVRSFGYIVI